MKAVVLERFGGVEHFTMGERKKPEPAPGELRIAVRAASFNPVDYKLRQGRFGGELPLVLGHDLSGEIDAVGEGVEGFSEGEPVCAYLGGPRSNGAYAEWVSVPAAFVARRPALSWEEAAAIPVVGLTAYEAVVVRAKLRSGESALITGASGGVGTMAIGLARIARATSILATAGSDESVAYLEGIGVDADRIIRHDGKSVAELEERVRAANGGRPVDAAFDFVGGDMKRLACAAVGFGGRVVTTVEEPAGTELHLFDGRESPLFRRSAELHFELLGARARFGGPADWRVYAAELDALSRLLDTGRLRALPIEVGDFSVETVRRAHEALESGRVKGKLVMRVR